MNTAATSRQSHASNMARRRKPRAWRRASNASIRSENSGVQCRTTGWLTRETVEPPANASEQRAGLVEDHAQDLLDLVEVLLGADQRRRELDDRVAAVVGAAVEALVVQRLGEVAAQQLLRLLVVEGLLGRLVLDQLDPVEVAVAADVADDRQVVELLQGGPERVAVVADVLEHLLVLEDVEVRHRDRGRDRVATERVAMVERVGALEERLHQPVGGDHRAERGVAG